MNRKAAPPRGVEATRSLRRGVACLLILGALTAGRVQAEANLVAHWTFDDGAGTTAADSSGNGLTGTLAGNPQWVAGVAGGALALDGSGDYVECGDILNGLTLPFTFTAWVNKQTAEDNTIVSSDDNASTYAGFWIHLNNNGSVAVNLGQNSGSSSGARRTKNSATGLYTPGTWFHLAVVVNGLTDMRILVDGLDAGGTYGGTGSGFATNASPFRLGTRAGAASTLNALIDDVRVYDGALTDAEIAALVVVDYPPQALGDTYTVTPDGALNAAAPGVLANDTDPNGATLTVLKVSDPTHGTVNLNADGSFTYTPDAGYTGFDAFTYKVNDGTFDSANATVSFHVDNEPDQLAAHWAFDEGAGQLARDSSGNGHTGEFSDHSQWGPGIIGTALELDGANDYVSCGDILNGLTLPFTFTAWVKKNAAVDRTIVSSDESSGTYAGFWVHLNSAGGVQISVGQNSGSGPGARRSKNSPSGVFTHGEWFHLATVVRGLTDMDILINGVNVGGTYDGTGSGFVTNASPFNLGTRVGDSGTLNASIDDIRVYDKALTESEVRSLFPNFAPEAADDGYAVEPDQPLVVGAPGPLANDTDFNADALIAAKVTEPAHGTVTLNADGSFLYAPDAGYTGTDSFTYKANDGEEDSAPATVTFYIGPVTAGLYAYWPFDENTGTTVADASGNGRDGTLGGGAAWVPGVSGSGMHFDGDDEHVLLNLGELPLPWTLAFLVKREAGAPAAAATILNSSNRSIRLEQYNNTKKVGITDWPPEPDLNYAFNYEAPIEEWAHITLVGTSSGTTLYVNAQTQGFTTNKIALPLAYMGRLDGAAMKGTLDEMRVYGRALDLEEIRSIAGPLAVKDTYQYALDTVLNVPAPGVLANDVLVDSAAFTVELVSAPAVGNLDLHPDGSFDYIPPAGDTLDSTFTYLLKDEDGLPYNTVTVALVGPDPIVESVTPARAYNTAPATLLVHGQNFPLYAGPVGPIAVRLSYPYGTATSTGTISSSLDLITCTIDLAGLHGWKFDVQLLENGVVTATLAEGFEVLNAQSAVRDLAKNRLDGEFSGTFPSGDGQPQGTFISEFRVAAPLATVEAISFAPDQVFAAPPASLSAQLSKPVAPLTANPSTAFLRGPGPDGVLGTADDLRVSGHTVSIVGGNQIQLDLASASLPNGDYQFVLGQAPPSGGLHFDGNDVIKMSDLPAYRLTDMTLSAWVRVDALTGQLRLIMRRGDDHFLGTPYWLGLTSANKLAFQINGTGGPAFVLEAPTAPPLNTWLHVAGTFESATKTMRLYINATEVASMTTTKLPYLDLPSPYANFCIGQIYGYSSYGFRGDIDEVRVWNYARSSLQIQAERLGTLIGNESGLVGYWPFDEASGKTATDHSNNANDGLLGGYSWVSSYDPQRTATGAPLQFEITDLAGNALDGEFPGPGGAGAPLPSGDGAAGGEFAVPFTIAAPLPQVASVSFTPGQTYAAAPGNLTATLTKDIAPASATAQTVRLTRAGTDGLLGTPDDVPVTGGAISLPAANDMKLDLTGLLLPNDSYRLTLATAPVANVLSFDGSNDFVSIPHSASLTLSDLSVEAWFRFESGGTANPRIVNKGNTDFEIYTLGTGATRQVQARIQVDPLAPASVTLTTTSSIAANEWHHVAITYNQTNFVLYLDGLPVAQAAETRALNTGTNLLAIGRKSATATDFWRGNIRDVRVWSVARSAAEIGAGMNANLDGTETGLAGLWKLTTGSGQTATDATANANDGTLGVDSAAGTDDPAWIDSASVTASLRDTAGNQLDGEFSGTFPSGDDVAGGDFTADFSVAAPLPKVTALSFTAGQTFAVPPANITVTVSVNLAPGSVSSSTVRLTRAGTDGLFGTSDDFSVVPNGVAVQAGNQIALDLSGTLLPNDSYRLTVLGTGASLVTDTSGNALDGEFSGAFPSGDGNAGGDFVADFDVDALLPVVTALSFTPGAALAAKPAQILTTLSKDLLPASVNSGTVRLVRAGADGTFGTSDDVSIQPTAIQVLAGNQIKLDLADIVMPNDTYRLTLSTGPPFAWEAIQWQSLSNVTELNSSSTDMPYWISPDGLTFYFDSNRPGGKGDNDIYRATRSNLSAPWNAPVLVPELNSSAFDGYALLANDELSILFTSTRGGGLGDSDIWTASRLTTNDSWNPPTNVSELNSSAWDGMPCISNDGLNLWFASARSGGLGNKDIWKSTRASTAAPWGAPQPVPELNSSSWDGPEWVSSDQCTMILSSNRSGGLGDFDFWVSTRPDTGSPWNPPVNLAELNSTGADRLLTMSSDTAHLWLASNRSGGLGQFDLWTAERLLGLCDLDGNLLDGEFSGTLPSGDGTAGGDFVADFSIDAPPPVVTALSFTDGQAFATPPTEVLATLSKAVSPDTVNEKTVLLVRAGTDGILGTADDVQIAPAAVEIVGGNQVRMDLAGSPLPNDTYRVTLLGGALPPDVLDGLVARWTFDESAGNSVLDSTGNGHTGTLQNGTARTAGLFGGGLRFDGIDDYVSISTLNVSVPWTVSTWVKRRPTPNTASYITNSSTMSLRLEQYNSTKRVGITKNGSYDHSFAYVAPTDEWIHLAFITDASSVTLFVNGVAVDSYANTVALAIEKIANQSLGLLGDLDDFRVYSRALTGSEVAQIAGQANGIADTDGNALDGEFAGTFPSGDDTAGGDFAAEFTVADSLPTVTALNFTPSAALPAGQSNLTATFSKDMNPARVNSKSVRLVRAGPDGTLGTADDVAVMPTALSVENGNQINVDLSGQSLVQDDYRLTLAGDPPYAWQTPSNVVELNTAAVELMSWISADEKTAFMVSGRSGGLGDQDIWMTTRASDTATWSAPVNATALNSSKFDGHAVLSADELTVYFTSARTGTAGNADIWTSTRASKSDPWVTPTQVAALNSGSFDEMPVLSSDGLTIWFASDRAGNHDVYVSTRPTTSDPWGAPSPVTELNSSSWDGPFWVSGDGLRMLVRSNRSGTLGGKDIWFSQRNTTASQWTTPVNVTELNSSAEEDILTVNAAESRIWFGSGRSGGSGSYDIYLAERMLPLTDTNENVLDGENFGGFPSGDGTPGGDFVADLTVDLLPKVTAMSPTPNSICTIAFSNDLAFGGHRYRLINQKMNWQNAKAYCESLGGYLACVGSAEENAFLVSLSPQESLWIGFTDEVTEGTFTWINGEPVVFTGWLTGEPNNTGNEDYTELRPDGTWNDYSNSPTFYFVCEFDDPDPTVTATLSEDFTPGTLTVDSFLLERSGGDKTFGDGNETTLVPFDVARTAAGVAQLDFTGVPLVEDLYRVRMRGDGVNAVTDLTGNKLDGEFSGTFPSGDTAAGGDFLATFAFDPTVPAVSTTVPANDTVSVDPAAAIEITFSEAMDHASAEAAFQILPLTSGSFSWSGNTMLFQPNANLSADTVYSVQIDASAKDWLGLPMAADYLFDFSTGASFPSGGTPLPAGVVKDLLQLGATAASRITGYPSSGQSILWDFLAFAGEGPEHLQQPLAGDAVTMHVGATETPLVWTEQSDADGSWPTGGTQSVKYWAIFVRAPSSRSTKIVATRSDDLRIWMDGQPDYMPLSGSPLSTPTFNLTAGWHRFIVKLYNNSGSGSMSFKFTNPDNTDMSDLFYTLTDPVPPQVDAFYPEPLAADVPRWHEVYIRFTEPMDTTVDPADVVSISGGSVAGSWAWTDRFTLVFTPSVLWDSGTTYTVDLTAANAKDRAGHPLNGQSSFSFTVTSALSTPSLTNFDMPSGTQGAAATNLTLNGSGFIEGGVIHPAGTLPWLPPGAPAYGEHYYYFSAYNTQNWQPAQAWLAAQGGHLATPTSPEEDAFLWRLIGYINGYFGGYDPDNNEIYSWVSGESWGYSNWADGEPNNFLGDTEICTIYW